MQEVCEFLVSLGSRAKLLSHNTKTECLPDMHKALDFVLSIEGKSLSLQTRFIIPPFINCCLQSASSRVQEPGSIL